MKSIFIHIGYHKTASTYLQKHFFPKLPVNFIFLKDKKIKDLLQSRKFKKKTFLNWLKRKIKKKYGSKNYSLTIISQEQLSGHAHGNKKINPKIVAQNLKTAFPRAKILIVIRNQLDYLLSIYAYRIAVKGYEIRSLNQFLKEEGKQGLFKKLEYDRLVKEYLTLFTKKNVLLLPMEMLKNSPQQFQQKITDFIDLPFFPLKTKIVNPSTNLKQVINFWRPINRSFKRFLSLLRKLKIKTNNNYQALRFAFYWLKQKTTPFLNLIFSFSNKLCLTTYPQYQKMKKRFKTSNQKLEKLTNLDLKKYSYPLD